MVKFHTVSLDDAQRLLLEKTVSSGQAHARTTTRARILLKADEGDLGPGWSDTRIAEALDVGVATVERIRKRAAQEGVETALHDRPRPPRRGKLDGETEAKLVALSCSPAPGGRDRWTLHLLARHFTDQSGISVSYELVRRTLKKTS